MRFDLIEKIIEKVAGIASISVSADKADYDVKTGLARVQGLKITIGSKDGKDAV